MSRIAPPIRRIAGNIVFGRDDNDAWAVYRIRCRSYRSEPERHKISLTGELESFARTAEADFQILRVTRSFDPDAYVENLMTHTPHRAHRGLWGRYVEGQRQSLLGLEARYPAVFLSVRLADPGQDVQERASRILERTPREILRNAGRKRGSEEILARAHATEARVLSCLDARPASANEIQWLIRRSLCRGVGEPRESGVEDGSTVHWLSEHGIDHQYRHVRVLAEEGNSFQAGMCLGEMDHAQAFSRQAELMFSPLEEHPWLIDACLSIRYVRNDQARRQLYHQFARTAHQLNEEEQATHGAMDDSHQRVALAREYHGRLGATGEPMLMGTLSFILSANSEKELSQRVQHLKEAYPWHLYRPYGDQLDVWLSHLPGQPCQVKGFERPFTPEQVGAMIPYATHEAGSNGNHAVYIGRTIHGNQPVFFDLREGSGTDKAPTIALVGSLGGGKTMFLQLLQYQAFLQGARIVDVDPKGDHRLHLLPEVAKHTHAIELGSSPEHVGKLDPLRIAPENERHDAAATFLIDVLPPVDAAIQAAISGAISRVIERYGSRACCAEVVVQLEGGDREEEQRAGYLLRQYSSSASLVRLGFARLDTPLPTRAEEQMTYLQIRAIKRAHIDTVRSEMSQSQRHGRAILQLVALYAMRILGEERDRLKVLSFDEASFLAQDAVGQQLLDTLARWGRSELAVPILSTQLLGDVTDQDNLIGHWFLFGMRSREHAVKALEALERNSQEPLVAALTEHYGKGRAFYRDLCGRSGEIQIDLGHSGLLEALSTTPVEEEHEEPEDVVRLAAGT